MNIEQIAEICYESNRIICEQMGDNSQLAWTDTPKENKKSFIQGVSFHLANPESTPEGGHVRWLEDKEVDGWKHGPIKDVEKKEHPCMVAYHRLPREQQAKDHLFASIVKALRPFISNGLDK